MEHNSNLVKDFKDALAGFNALLEKLSERVYDLNDDIEENVTAIELAYNEIKKDRAELAEIAEATSGVVTSVEEISEEADGVKQDGDNILNNMYSLVEEGYIDDDDFTLVDDNGDEVERDEEDETDYIAPETAENN